jgi:hypothetical protein
MPYTVNLSVGKASLIWVAGKIPAQRDLIIRLFSEIKVQIRVPPIPFLPATLQRVKQQQRATTKNGVPRIFYW